MSETKQITVRLPADVYAAAAAAAEADRRKLAAWCAIKIEEAAERGHCSSDRRGKGAGDEGDGRRFPKPKATGSNPVGVNRGVR